MCAALTGRSADLQWSWTSAAGFLFDFFCCCEQLRVQTSAVRHEHCRPPAEMHQSHPERVSVCTWTEQIPEQRRSFPVIWHQSCSDPPESTADPPSSTAFAHYPPGTKTNIKNVKGLKACGKKSSKQKVWSMYWCTWCTRYSSSSRMLSLCSVVVLLLFNWSNKRLIICNYRKKISEIQQYEPHIENNIFLFRLKTSDMSYYKAMISQEMLHSHECFSS